MNEVTVTCEVCGKSQSIGDFPITPFYLMADECIELFRKLHGCKHKVKVTGVSRYVN